jgi:hypothetical protein
MSPDLSNRRTEVRVRALLHVATLGMHTSRNELRSRHHVSRTYASGAPRDLGLRT